MLVRSPKFLKVSVEMIQYFRRKTWQIICTDISATPGD